MSSCVLFVVMIIFDIRPHYILYKSNCTTVKKHKVLVHLYTHSHGHRHPNHQPTHTHTETHPPTHTYTPTPEEAPGAVALFLVPSAVFL